MLPIFYFLSKVNFYKQMVIYVFNIDFKDTAVWHKCKQKKLISKVLFYALFTMCFAFEKMQRFFKGLREDNERRLQQLNFGPMITHWAKWAYNHDHSSQKVFCQAKWI